MRQSTHDMPVGFRINRALLARAEEKARRRGMSLSELLRHAVREEVGEAA